MKKLLLSLLLSISIYAGDVTLGGGEYFQTMPYKGVDTKYIPTPVVFFDNHIFYVRWSQVGVYFLGAKEDDFIWAFSITAQPRPNGYNSSDSEYLAGMENRDSTIEGGLEFMIKKGDNRLHILALTDLLNKHEAYLIKTELATKFKLKKLSFYPSVIGFYQSSDFLDYYYGVQKKEVDTTINRGYYKPNAGYQIALQTYIEYPITKKLSTLLNIRADRLSNEVTDSPIVDKNYYYSGMLSLIYTFDY